MTLPTSTAPSESAFLAGKCGIERLFRAASDDVCCNTSYPIGPSYFAAYRDSACDIMDGVGDLSFYVHVPFCRSLCRFCEYTRVRSGDLAQEARYVDLLERQVQTWTGTHPHGRVVGLDVGGGTPTALNVREFARVLGVTRRLMEGARTPELEPSIEFSYSTIDEEKIAEIGKSGFVRASTGLQLVDEGFLKSMDRVSSNFARMQAVNAWLRSAGVKKINLDVMYGFPGQKAADFEATLRVIERLQPDQVTLYETRFNMNALSHVGVTRESNYALYAHLYDQLRTLGYRARFGQNAFSFQDDEGVSSYLQHRMFDGIPYKGFGISAQSMSAVGLAYNSLKGFRGERWPEMSEIAEQDVYRLPGDELVAKYVAVALYGGKFYLPVITRFLEGNAGEHYAAELDYLVAGEYLTVDAQGKCLVTQKGFREYGAIAALFWSKAHKRRWLAEKGIK